MPVRWSLHPAVGASPVVLFSYADNPFFFSALGKMKYIYRAQSFKKISYPEYNVLNLHKKIEANKYDWVILDQVLEHVENPFQAILHLISSTMGTTTCDI